MKKHPKFTVFQDKVGQWRWTLIAANGEPVADSGGDGHGSKDDVLRALVAVRAIVPVAGVSYIVKPRKKAKAKK